jgi:aarF domain-containing kinase
MWKGLITQDEEMIKSSIQRIGIDGIYYRLFAGMVTAQDWDRIMDKNQDDLGERLEVKMEKESLEATRAKSQIWMKQILWCLQTMDPDLLLIFKVNDYLRTLDWRLGRPVNTFYFTVSFHNFLQFLTLK